jgi:hypothetical protein
VILIPYANYVLEKKSSCLLHNYIYMQVIFMYLYFTYYHNTLAYLTLVMLYIYKYLGFQNKNSIEQNYLKENTWSFGIFKNILFLTWNLLINQMFYKHVLKLPSHYSNQKHLRNFENIMNLLNHVCFVHPICFKGCHF